MPAPDKRGKSSRAGGVGEPHEILRHCVLALGEALERLASNLREGTARRKNMNKSRPPRLSRQSPVQSRKTDGQC